MNINDKIAKLLSSKSIEDNIIGIEYLMYNTDFKKLLKRMKIHKSVYFSSNVSLRDTFPSIAIGENVFKVQNGSSIFKSMRTLKDFIDAGEHVICYEE